MLSEDQKKSVIRDIPEDFTFEDTHFHTQKLYANQFECDSFPAVVLQYMSTDNIVNRVLKNVLKETKIRTETFRPSQTVPVTITVPSIIKLLQNGTPPNIKIGGYSCMTDGITYTASRNVTLGHCSGLGGRTCPAIGIGQTIWGSNWWIERTFLYFDVSSLPLSAIISAAKFKFMSLGKYDGQDNFFNPIPFVDFDIDVQVGDGIHPTLPKVTPSDISRLFYSGSGSVKINTSAMVLDAWSELSLTDAKAWIKASRVLSEEYRMIIRALDDIDGNEIIGGFLDVYTPEDTGKEPYIEITYTEYKITFACDHTMSVQEVTGTVGGLPYIFDSAEYELIEEGPVGYFKALKFLGPNVPDPNTDVTVTYTAACLYRTLAAMKRDNLLINVYCDDVFEGKRKINGIKLCNYIAMKVHQWFEYTFQDDTMTVRDVTPILDGDFESEGEVVRRKYFTVEIIYWEVLEETPIETIETVDDVPVTPQT